MSLKDIYLEIFPVLTIFTFILGTCIGSFLNVVIWRLPRRESLSTPPSHCPKCNHAIRPWENIPLISWLCLRGRCSACKEPISARYPAVELLTGAVFLLLWFRLAALEAPLPSLLNLFFLGAALLAVTFTDIETRMIPNKVTYAGMVVALLGAALVPATLPGWLAGTTIGTSVLPGTEYHPGLYAGIPQRLHPLFSSLAGILLPLALLWAIRVLAGVTSGRTSLRFENEPQVRLDSSGIRQDGTSLVNWEEIVGCSLVLRNPQMELNSGEPPDFAAGETHVFTYRGGKLRTAGWETPLGQVTSLRGQAVSCTVTRDVFGWGDIKLVMMIGALLGIKALPLVLAVSAGLGVALGTLLLLGFPALKKQGVPFAPFLACGCAAWIFFGREFMQLLGG